MSDPVLAAVLAASLASYQEEKERDKADLDFEKAIEASKKPEITEPSEVPGIPGLHECKTGGINLCGPLCVAFLLQRQMPKYYADIDKHWLLKMLYFGEEVGSLRGEDWIQKVAVKFGVVIKVKYLQTNEDGTVSISDIETVFEPAKIFTDDVLNLVHDQVKQHYLAYLP